MGQMQVSAPDDVSENLKCCIQKQQERARRSRRHFPHKKMAKNISNNWKSFCHTSYVRIQLNVRPNYVFHLAKTATSGITQLRNQYIIQWKRSGRRFLQKYNQSSTSQRKSLRKGTTVALQL